MSVMLDSRTLRAAAGPSAPSDWQPHPGDADRLRRTMRRRDRRELRETLRRGVLALVATD